MGMLRVNTPLVKLYICLTSVTRAKTEGENGISRLISETA